MEKKKSVKNVILTVLLLLLAAALVIIPFALEKLQETVEDKGSVHSAVASLASVSRTVSGAGTLTDEETVEVKLPYGVEVTKYLVENNDFVVEGQPLVEVDRVTVMNSIKEYQQDLEYVETQMARYTDTGATNFLTTASAGRVMEIYAKAGDSINDVMLEHGALAVLSLDGLLAVDIENSTVSVGSSVNVTAPDGSVVSGRVESRKNGVIVITLPQDDRAVGETVSVSTKNGEVIGSGELYVHSPLKITGYTGIIEAVHVKIDQDMYRNGTVFTYSGNSNSAEYGVYAAKHTELSEYMDDLFKMYTDGTVNAKCTGVVSGIDEDAAAELLAAKGEAKAALDFLVNRGDRPQVMTAADEGFPEEVSSEPLTENVSEMWTPFPMSGWPFENADWQPPEGEGEHLPEGEDKPLPEDESGQLPEGEDEHLSEGEDEHLSEGEDEQPSETPEPTPEPQQTMCYRIGLVTNVIKLDSTLGHVRYVLSTPYSTMNEVILAVQQGGIEPDPSIEVRELDIPSYNVSMSNVPQETVTDSADTADSTEAKGRYLLECYAVGQTGETASLSNIVVLDKNGEIVSPGKSSSKTNSAASGASEKEPVYEYYSTKQSEVMDVTPQDKMTIDITVDELDILSIQRGQAVQITLDALTGQSFDGVITDIGVSGSNSGGNSKYTAEVTIDRAANMIAGMNATALITLSTSENLVTIPSEALICEGNRTYVYTGYDEKNDVLINPVDVTTGASDGIVTEITSGLKEGDRVWYNYFDKLDNGFDFGG